MYEKIINEQIVRAHNRIGCDVFISANQKFVDAEFTDEELFCIMTELNTWLIEHGRMVTLANLAKWKKLRPAIIQQFKSFKNKNL